MSAPPIDRDLTKLAPAFLGAVQHGLARCADAGKDAYISEAGRSNALQAVYFAAGTSKAKDVSHSWHGYLLAVDVISRSRGWTVWPERNAAGVFVGGDPSWYQPVIAAFKDAGCAWGGDWRSIFDAPHFQWGKMPSSPTDEDRALLASDGAPAVWSRYSAG